MRRFFFVLLAAFILSFTGIVDMPTASANSFDSLNASARKYLGAPYRYGGTTSSGFDCSGYTQVVFRENGISIPRSTSGQFGIGQSVSKNNLQAGDLVFFNTTGRGVSHVGIYVGNNNFIHASTSRGVMVSSIYDPYYWGSRYIGAKRVKNFTTATPKPAEKPVEKPAEEVKPKEDPLPTRADIAVALTNKLNLEAEKEVSVFEDVSNNHPEIASIAAVAEAGIFTGNNGAFMPNGNLTRGQLAKVLVEAFNLKGRTPVKFTDVPDDHWATEYIEILYYNDITTGYLDGSFGLNDYVTKKQLETFIERITK